MWHWSPKDTAHRDDVTSIYRNET